MTLEQLGKRAGAVSAILIALTLLLGLFGRVAWEMWLENRIRLVVRTEVRDIRLSISEIAYSLDAPDSVRVRIKTRNEFGPTPSPED